MLTYALAESRNDREAMRAVRNAEKKHGMKTGVRFSDEGQHLVEVSLYPSVAWWITDTDTRSVPTGERRPLSPEAFALTRGLSL